MAVLTCGELGYSSLEQLLNRFRLSLTVVADNAPIPGSWFGEPEAGVIKTELLIRSDTPVHSALHEACHVICMDETRRAELHTDTGGDYDEENAVCYLQLLLADHLADMGRERMMQDMDEWGYSFRLGSTRAWFTDDAEDARDWLIQHELIQKDLTPNWRLR
ncbi:MAG: hypothetical protein OEX12_12045 [Gammaproteobacteria bacterium]|nr:hypothetical protein [Gammaproteobacteria bacterium]